jgi:hypothetical protein
MPSLNGWNAYATALPNGSNGILNSTVPTNANDTGNDGAMTSSVEHRVRSGVDPEKKNAEGCAAAYRKWVQDNPERARARNP